MPLRLPSKNETVGQPESEGDCKGKAKLRRSESFDYKSYLYVQTKLSSTASSYYPGCGDPGCSHGTHDVPLPDPYGGDNDTDDNVETEEDWMGDELIAELTPGSTSKFSEAVAREVSVQQPLGFSI